MRKNALNRKFRRMLAASLGAVSFVSTSCVVNAVDPKYYVALDIARFFESLPIHELNLKHDTLEKSLARIVTKHWVVNGENFGLDEKTKREIIPNQWYEYKVKLNGITTNIKIHLKRQIAAGNANAKHYRMCAPLKKEMPDPDTLAAPPAPLVDTATVKINWWAHDSWEKLVKAIKNEIKKQEKAEADARARAEAENEARERNLLASSTSNQNTPPSTFSDPSTATSVAIVTSCLLPATMSQISSSQPITSVTPGASATSVYISSNPNLNNGTNPNDNTNNH